MDGDASFGYWVRRRRKALDLTQDALARQVGCAETTIRKIEADARRPSRQTAERLAECLAIPAAERMIFLQAARAELAADRLADPTQGANGQPADAPLSRTLDRCWHNLPAQPTALIGRTEEIAAVRNLVRRDDVRLVTLTGPGGTGKTRLALQAAAELLDAFTDGVYFVNLAPISDPTLVVSAIAQTLGIKETGSKPLLDSLTAYLRDKQQLLLLDNFEQVVEAAPRVAELLSSAPGLKVLVSSRAVLHLYGEYEFGVPPLSLPDLSHVPPLEGLTQYEAVRLFIDRALAVKPDFAVTNANAPAVAEICHRVDGLPLAIELAAARVKLFSPEVLLKRLERCLPLLTGWMRDLPARQQTLGNTIDWSYQLLDAGEQMLFRRLAVFVGGCTLAAAEAVCNATDERSSDRERSASLDMLDKLIALVDKSVLRQETGADGEPRFMMLETIREYAWEQMDKSEETDTIRRRHALFFLRLVEIAEPQLQTAEQIVWLDRLEAEHNNLGAALTWSLSTEGNVEIGLRFAAALWRFWSLRNHLSEGQAWCAAVLAQPDASRPTRLRARVLSQAAYLAGTDYELAELNDSALARRFHEGSLAICQVLDDRHGTAYALYGLGQVTAGDGNLAEATTLYQQSLTLCQAQGDLWGSARALHALGNLAVHQGNGSQAAALLGESLAVWRTVGDTSCIAMVLHSLGSMAYLQGDNNQAAAWLQESLTLSRALRSKGDIARTLHRLGDIEREQGHIEQAMALLEESLVLAQELGDTSEVAWILDGLGDVALQQDDPARAAARYQESLRLCRELDHTFGIVIALYCLGRAAMQQGDYVQAVTMLEESLTLVRPLGIKMHITACLRLLGRAALFQGDAAQAAVRYQESIRLAQEMGQQSIIIQCLEGLAEVATVWGRADRAAHVFGAAEAWREVINSPLPRAERSIYERVVASVRAQLGDAACAVAWAEGRAMPLEQVIVEALGIADAVQADAP